MHHQIKPSQVLSINHVVKVLPWRARLVADGTGLENRKGFTLLVGSNPTPSALALNVFSAYM